ncbi:lung adenoma susceptibility protein 2 [Ascaphus truei]|uniref:lung adenoma susceptibility protein 2 n=1 Tax=Ascaphus truei TaxID=8439 RepID=UPI003F597BD7
MAKVESSSPESSISISSLLASCSLSSSNTSSHSFSSIEYKDKLYDSATKALEAYIEDYEGSLQSPIVSTGKITIRTSSDTSNKSSRHCITKTAPGNSKGKSKNSFSSMRRRVATEPDLFSLTTDDLLSFPSDGSLPLSQTYLSEQKLQRRSRKQHGSFVKHPPLSSSQQASSLNTRTRLDFLNLCDKDVPDPSYRQSRNMQYITRGTESENKPHSYKPVASPYSLKETSLLKGYPRWLTSQKSDLSISGITSIPDVKYPVWLKNHDLLSDSDSQAAYPAYKSSGVCSFPQTSEKQPGTASLDRLGSLHVRFNDSYSDHDVLKKRNTCSSVMADAHYQHDLDIYKHLNTLLKDDPIDLLLQKSEHCLDCSRKRLSSPLKNDGSPRTEDVLEAERSWEKIPFPFKSPVPMSRDDEGLPTCTKSERVCDSLNDCIQNDCPVPVSTFSGGNHHGPVEALKHMLFNLQTVQQSFIQSKTKEPKEECKKISKDADSELRCFDQEMFPVNRSLQKALHHLSRLKDLVEDTSIKQDQEKNLEP